MRSYLFAFLCFSSAIFGKMRTEPWLTEEAIEFLDNYLEDTPDAIILEFGSGASTLWFAERTQNLHSIEDSLSYFNKIEESLRTGDYYQVDYRFSPRPYYNVCNDFPDEFFDLILVDGRNRKGCIAHAIPKLKPGGILMLDNAERIYYHSVFPLMKNWEHISTTQTKPDKFGFVYPGWRTDWWVKPKEPYNKRE